MKILLISDTHGELDITRAILQKHMDIDLCLHLGDIGFDLTQLPYSITAVRGNHDRNTRLPKKLKLKLEGHKLLALHGNIFDDETVQEVFAMKHVADEDLMELCMTTLYGKLAAYAKRKGCDILVFGHTHHQCQRIVDGVTLVNPGSIALGTPDSGYAIMTIKEAGVSVQFYKSADV